MVPDPEQRHRHALKLTMPGKLQKILSAAATLWLTATLVFFLLRVLPGDAIEAQLAQSGASQSVIDQRRAELGLTDPLLTQYFRFIGGAMRGDLGVSLSNSQPVTELISQQLSPTVELAAGALILAAALGLIVGATAALDTPLAKFAQLFITAALSAPVFWTGIIAINLFATQLHWLPTSGAGSFNHLILPVAVLGFHTSGAIGRVTQNSVRETARADFVRAARAKGLRDTYILRQHILRASLIPILSVITLQAGFLLGGTVITESLFVRPGIGRLLLQATLQQDYPVVQGVALLSAAVYTLLDIAADLIYPLIDPRAARPDAPGF